MKALEIARTGTDGVKIGKSLDARLKIGSTDSGVLELLRSFTPGELCEVFITSGCSVTGGSAGEGAYLPDDGTPISVLVSAADGRRCDRCWCYSEDGEETEDGGFICAKCAATVRLIEADLPLDR